MNPAQGVQDVVPGVVIPGASPIPFADASANGHPNKKEKKSVTQYLLEQSGARKRGGERENNSTLVVT